MSSVRKQLAIFAAVLAALFGAGALAGQLIDPDARGDESEAHGVSGAGAHGGNQDATAGADADAHGGSDAGAHSDTAARGHAARPVRGLAVAENGLRLEVERPELRAGRAELVRFRILGDDGNAVRDFDVEHTKRMHLIVARRDLTGFQHLHPRMAADGTWSTRLTLPEPGSYRLFADFSHGGEASTLATDLRVDGDARLEPLPAPTSRAASDGGYDVRLDSTGTTAGRESQLRFTIARDGRPVEPEPYLGAGGHLVALREGDMAFLHVHPDDDGVGFTATFPTAGRYRLFLQFKHEGRVQTVAFTQEVGR